LESLEKINAKVIHDYLNHKKTRLGQMELPFMGNLRAIKNYFTQKLAQVKQSRQNRPQYERQQTIDEKEFEAVGEEHSD